MYEFASGEVILTVGAVLSTYTYTGQSTFLPLLSEIDIVDSLVVEVNVFE